MPSNITGAPSAQITNIDLQTRLVSALDRLFQDVEVPIFATNNNLVQEELNRTFKQHSQTQVRVKPKLSVPTNLTNITTGSPAYEDAAYGGIDVTLDYLLTKGFSFGNIDQSMIDADMEKDMMEEAMRVMMERYMITVNARLRTASLADNLGTAGSALNATVFRNLRTRATTQGISAKTPIHVRLAPLYFAEASVIADLQNVMGNVPTAGAQNPANNIASDKFYVGGFFNMYFYNDSYYERPTPVSDPVGSAYIETSAVTPILPLAVVNSTKQSIVKYKGMQFLYTKTTADTNGGLVVRGKLDAVYGFAEVSDDIDSGGVVVEHRIWNILGGASALTA